MDSAREGDLEIEVGASAVRVARRRSLWIFAALAAGYVVARGCGASAPGWAWPAIGAAVAMCACALRGRVWHATMLTAVVLAGMGIYTWRIVERPTDSLAWMLERDARGEEQSVWGDAAEGVARPRVLGVTGWVCSPPRAVRAGGGALGAFYRHERAWAFEIETVRVAVAERAEGREARGRLRVRMVADGGFDRARGEDGRELRIGDVVHVRGVAMPVIGAMNPSEFDRRALAAQRGIAGTMSVPTELLVRHVDAQGARLRVMDEVSMRWVCWLGTMRAHAERVLSGALVTEDGGSARVEVPRENEEDPLAARGGTQAEIGARDADVQRRMEGRALIGAMLLGTNEEHLDGISGAFTRLGLTHLVAISGVNMVLLAGLVLATVRLFGDRGRLEPLILGGMVVLYLLILPAQAPAIRGGVMVLVLLIADAFGRRYDRLSVLGWIAVGVVLWRPLELFSAGFQLSFGIVGAYMWTGARFHERLFGERIRGVQRPALPAGQSARFERYGVRVRMFLGAVRNGAAKAVSSCVLAWLVATPIVAYHMGLVSPIAIVATLVVAPLCAVVLWVGYGALLIGTVWSAARSVVMGTEVNAAGAPVIGDLLDWCGVLTVRLVRGLDALPMTSVQVPAMSVVAAGLALAAVLYWVRRGHVRDRRAWALGACAVVWVCAEFALVGGVDAKTALRIDALAVGDGACVLLRTAHVDTSASSRGETRGTNTAGTSGSDDSRTDGTLLWDCGSPNPSAGVRLIPDALRAMGVSRLDTVVITHGDLDRFGALLDVAERFEIGRVVMAGRLLSLATDARTRPGQASPVALAANALVTRLKELEIPIETVSETARLRIGEHTLTLLGSDADAMGGLEKTMLAGLLRIKDANEQRVVVLANSAEGEVLRRLRRELEKTSGERAEVVVLPQNGRRTGASAEMVSRASPRAVMALCGVRTGVETIGEWTEERGGPGMQIDWVATGVRGAYRVKVGNDGKVWSVEMRPRSAGRMWLDGSLVRW